MCGVTRHSIDENLRVWDREHTWPEDGDEWKGQAARCGVPYEAWKQSVVERLVDPYARPGATVLEIGPGHGRWSEALARRAGRLILVDLSPRCIEHCRNRLSGRAGVETFVTGGNELPPGLEGAVDLVWSYDAFVHIAPSDIQRYLKHIRRVLKPGGWAVIHHANRRNWTLPFAGLARLGGLFRRAYNAISLPPGDTEDGWRSPVSAGSFARMAAAAGLDVWQQLSRWGAGLRMGVPRFDDRVTVLRKPDGPAAVTAGPVADRLPDFLCVGAQKAGTTTLGQMLRHHRSVFVAPIKEVHYFSINSERSRDWYASHFDGASPGQRRGELTPYYLFHPAAPRRIRSLLPHVRLIALVRDPVERALSGYFHSVRLGLETLSLEDALEREEARLAGADAVVEETGGRHESHQSHSYVARSRYEAQLARYLAHFPASQLLVLKAEDLFADPAAVWRRVLGFLELEPTEWSGPAPVENAGRGEAAAVSPETRAKLRAMLAPTYESMARDHGIRW